MDRLKKPAIAAVIAATVAVSILVARSGEEKVKCVIPDCDKTEKEVDCYETLSRPPDRKPQPYWVGCNVFPAELATGKQCIPAACTTAPTTKKEALREKVKR